MRKIGFSQRNQNTITCMQYKNSKFLENSIDNPSTEIFNFSLKAAICDKFHPAKFPKY